MYLKCFKHLCSVLSFILFHFFPLPFFLPSELQNLESAILEACLVKGLVPSHQLLKSVHSLVQLVLLNRVVRVTGSWEAGRRECIELTAEVIKSTGYSLNMISLPIDAMHTGGLLGEK